MKDFDNIDITLIWKVNNKTMENKLTGWQIFGAILAGLFVGFVNGFLGSGGGMLVVPLLRLIFKQSPRVAHSTAVLVILPVSLVSSIAYLIGGHTGINMLWQVAIGTFGGGLIGTFLLSKLKGNVITILFSLVMIGAGIFIILKCFM